jgi:prepilin-type processing-associated H-X9-DG protein
MEPRRRWPLSNLVRLAVVAGLVVIVFGMLTAFLLRARERANRVRCADNLRTVAAAVKKYHEVNGRYPPGWLGPNPDGPYTERAPNAGVFAYLLPHLYAETQKFPLPYFQADPGARTDPPTDPVKNQPYRPPSDVPWWQLAHPAAGINNLTFAQLRLPVLRCPSAEPYQATERTLVALHVYGAAAPQPFLYNASFDYETFPQVRGLGLTNYLGVAGTAGRGSAAIIPTAGQRRAKTWGDYEGIFANRSPLTQDLVKEADGFSNTLLFGETIGGTEAVEPGHGEVQREATSWMCGALPTAYGLPDAGRAVWYTFSSRHAGVVQFAFADGSARSFRRGRSAEMFTDEWWVLQEMAGWRDGSAPEKDERKPPSTPP